MPCVEPARGAFITWLRNLQISDTDSWIALGDFNFYRSTENRNRPGGNILDTFAFNEAIGESGLIELPIKGRAFTWSNMQQNPLLEQLDWFLTSVNGTATYPNTEVLPLAKPISDHMPCKAMIGTSIPKAKIFRFENFWPDHPSFFEVVQNSWSSSRILRSNAAANISVKCKELRKALKTWSKNISQLAKLIDICNKVIFFLDSLEECRVLSLAEWNLRKLVKAKLLQLLRSRNLYWKQRHTVNRIKYGDECTKFFHAMATMNYRKNSIPQLLNSSGNLVSDHESKASLI